MMPPSNNYSFLIADDHSIVRVGVSTIIKEIFSNTKIYTTGKFIEILSILKQININLLILEANFPDGNSINIITTIKTIRPEIKILIFSAYDENIYAMRYLKAGASGYLNKESSEDEMKHALQTIISTGKFITQNIKDKILNSYFTKNVENPLILLSNRETEVAHLLIKGYSNLEISALLNIQKTTVSTYRIRILKKLKIDNLADMIKIFELYMDNYIYY